MDTLEILLAVSVGLGLSASCGFRIFIPPLVMSVAAHQGHLTLGEEFAWMASPPAIIALGVATVFELGAYYIPWMDNLLDSVSTPVAAIAGIGVAAATFGEMEPMLKWSMAIIAGGGSASAIQLGTVAIRAASSVTTGGLGNPVVSTGEGAAATGLSLMAIIVPLLAVCTLALCVFLGVRAWQRKRPLPSEVPSDLPPSST